MLKKYLSFLLLFIVDFLPLFAQDFEGRYIAHAGGNIDNHIYTNTLEALDKSYADGFRYFELDFLEDVYGNVLAVHEWEQWKTMTGCDSICPITEKHFLEHKIYERYTPLNMERINQWFLEHEDAVLVTDKINQPTKMASLFVDKERLIMELFSFEAIEEAKSIGVKFMLSECLLNLIVGDKVQYFLDNNINYLAVSRRLLAENQYKEMFSRCKEHDIKVYVFNVNYDEGKDEKYVYDNEMQYVYGMYADKWIEEFEVESAIKNIKKEVDVSFCQGTLNVRSDEHIQRVLVFDSFGRCVLAVENINDKTFSKRIATSGVFTIRIQTESEIVSKKALNF